MSEALQENGKRSSMRIAVFTREPCRDPVQQQPHRTLTMKQLIVITAILSLTVGCARFSTKQTEVRNDTETTITTKATAYTLWAGKSALSNWKAAQSDGEQTAEVGSLDQETSGGTNVVQALDGILKIVEAVK